MKNTATPRGIFTGIIGAALGITLITVNGPALLGILSKIIGIFLIIVNIPDAVLGATEFSNKLGRIRFISAAVGIVIGIVMVFLTSAALKVGMIIAGVWFLVLPIYDILTSPYKSEQFKVELPKMLIGVMLVVLGPLNAIDVIFKVIGWCVLILSVVMIVACTVSGLRQKR